MKHRIAGITAATAMAASALVVTAVPAQAATCAITGFTPTTVVVGLQPVTRTVDVKTSGCVNDDWLMMIGSDGRYYADSEDPQIRFVGARNTDARGYPVEAAVGDFDNPDADAERSWTTGFRLKRRAAWSTGTVNAGPEPVKAGAAITIKGRLVVADWDADRYRGAPSKSVMVQFRTPTGSYATVKTVTTSLDGWVSTKVTARQTGAWRLVYSGSSIRSAATSVGDGVEVR